MREGITDAGGKVGFDTADGTTGSWGNTTIAFPRIQGADVAGTIVAVGQGVNPARIGDRIIIDPWLLAADGWLNATTSAYFGSEVDGGFAEYTKVRSENALTINSALSDEQLATFPCALGTAENLVARSGLQPGESVVIAGASGGVGSMAIQLCRLRGARVIAIASAFKADILTQLGVDCVIDRKGSDLEAAIVATAQGPVDVALDVVGGNLFMPMINALRQGGRYSTSGAIAGPVVEFDLRQLIYKDLQLTGATIVPPGTMKRLIGLIEKRKLQPLLAHSFPLQSLAEAQEVFLQKKHVGSIFVNPGKITTGE